MDRCLDASPCHKDSLHGCLQVAQKWNICPVLLHAESVNPFVTILVTRAIPCKQQGGKSSTPQKLLVQLLLIGEGDYQFLDLSHPATGTPSRPTATDSSLHTCYQSQAHMLRLGDFCCLRSILFSYTQC